jgi:hypothetical protein
MPFGGLLAGLLVAPAGFATTLLVFFGVFLAAAVPPFAAGPWRES